MTKNISTPYQPAIPTGSNIVELKINETVDRLKWLVQNGYFEVLCSKLKDEISELEVVDNTTLKFNIK